MAEDGHKVDKFVAMKFLEISITIQDDELTTHQKCDECMKAMKVLIDEQRKMGKATNYFY